ncbi:ATP synthase F0 subunit A [Candidatus Falkowbacteria bacterium CG10_big_fil_rev_8_21_14_0_10_39_9]|uniref:ATP synthase subunit a n=1 Tax=Candidatus Falkowbacteria bacterium CG10_big_fil_rev_8_21_14_0_10_39_9 TaxID=1974566 RepID=A0A2M6WPI3_9BACT|nr:MAG: ATP synthase F0 subunit A [Candidatus Falkowbacteria bacterium CG10_big_fil_rev_8_21_14_0_10_39_9]
MGEEQVLHENTLYAEPVFHVGQFPITNSMINSWLVVIIVVTLAWSLKGKINKVPRGLQNALEMVFEAFFGIFDSVTGNRKKTLQFAPFVLAFFFFILINNWMGLLPGVGSIGQIVREGEQQLFIPYFRGATADLNTTLALAALAVVASHVMGVIALGWWKYLNKFLNFKILLEISKKILKDPTILLVNPIKFFVGLIEIVGELAKVASLSFRLFGNIFAGEVLLASMSAILAFGLPLPFMFLEVIVGLIQALIFSILVLIYLSIATTAEEH